ncbi:MAG: DUF2877 domain-containing protein [Spirochaetota bacterium]
MTARPRSDVASTLVSRGSSFPENAHATIFSTHEHAINLRVPESDELLSITTSLDAMTVTSLGLHATSELADLRALGLERGAPVRVQPGLVESGPSRLVLTGLSCARVFDGSIRARGSKEAGETGEPTFATGRGMLLDAIVERALGDGFAPVAARLATGDANVGPDNPFATAAWARLQGIAPEASLAALGSLIGLGQGLTPSGDDFVVGVLAARAVAAGTAPAGTFAPDTASADALRARLASTTLAGATIVSQALRGCFPAYLCEFARAFTRALVAVEAHTGGASAPPSDASPSPPSARTLIRAAVNRAARHGHSSGIDALTGFAWGLPASA